MLPLALLLLIAASAEARIEWSKKAGPRGGLQIENNFSYDDGVKFDYVMLTRIYPSAVCRADDDSVPGSCEIPQGTPTWSIHGLWPNYDNGSYPQFCDGHPKKFDPKLIEQIRSRLLTLWPNLYPSKTADSFWKHEWEKHGTCAESDFRMASEMQYFMATIDLNTAHSVEAALKEGGIVPRQAPYAKGDIEQALIQNLGKGKNVQFNCLKDKKTGQALLGDVRICLNQDFELMSCPKERSSQPVTEILGESPPLPSFSRCPDHITYLHDDSARAFVKEPVPLQGLTYFVHPFIQLYPKMTLLSNYTFMWICLPIILVGLVCLLHSHGVRRNGSPPPYY